MANFPTLQLELAVKAGDVDEVQMLLRQGHDIGELNPITGVNSLHLAVLMGNSDIVELLSREETHINSTCSLQRDDCEGFTPLHFSVGVCNENVTRLLLSRKANVNKQDKHGNTALHIAAGYGFFSKKTYSFLLNGHDIFLFNGTVSDYAKAILNDERITVSGYCEMAVNEERITMNGYCDMAVILLQSGANAELINEYSETALHVACKVINENMVRLILKNCSNIVNYKNEENRTALHVAANIQYNSLDLVKTLIEYDADMNSTDRWRCTPLYYACKSRRLDITQILVKNGCDVNIGGDCRPIQVVVNQCDEKILKLLLQYGADTSRLDSFSSFHVLDLETFDTGMILFASCCKVFFKPDMNSFECSENFLWLGENVDSFFEVFKLLLQYAGFKNINRNDSDLAYNLQIFTCFVKYVIKMKILGCYFAKDYPDIDGSKIILLPEEKIYKENCEKEVDMLKGKLICSSGISIHDFLKKDLNKLVRCLKNEDIINELQSLSKSSFPIYGHLIKDFFKLGMQRRLMLDRCYACFYTIFRQLLTLPDMVVEKIFDNLTTEDLRILLTKWDPNY